MKKLIILIAFMNLFGLTNSQISNMRFSFQHGKRYNLGWTLIGISYVESNLGKYPMNLSDPSGSQYHILISSVMNRNHIPDTAWNRSRMMEKLIKNKRYAVKQAISELLYWKAYWIRKGYTGTWLWVKMVGSYNGGYYSNIGYARKVAKAIKRLRRKHIM